VAKQTKYIFVTGGVLSGLGKGIAAASLGAALKARDYDVNIQKCDPYLNTDAGTLNPAEHGEVFVTADGAETDLDLGHYERFLDQELGATSSLMNGKIYAKIIADERSGKYLGKTVQIIPHVTGEIQEQIEAAGRGHEIHIVEIGGTVGDYESLAFLDAIRQFRRRVGRENVIVAHLVYLPYLEASKELKTKPAQNTVRDLREAGVQADIILARAERPVSEHILHKISLFCDVPVEAIVPLPTVPSVYKVPLALEHYGLADYVCSRLGLDIRKPDLSSWEKLNKAIADPDKPVAKIGVVAKYMDHEDTYMSVFEAIKAAAWAQDTTAEIMWIDSEKIEEQGAEKFLADCDGIVVPGGFGSRGVDGKIMAASYAMEHKRPYLGLCLGMQVGVIALARQAVDPKATTAEVVADAKHAVIAMMDAQRHIINKGGTMRLGNYPCEIKTGTKTHELYGLNSINERHRHRYEFNNKYRDKLEEAGLVIAGTSPDGKLVEMIELENHPFFIGSQFHPEFKSRPNRPHPLFEGFIKAVKAEKKTLTAKARN
jgi:CTP synthase